MASTEDHETLPNTKSVTADLPTIIPPTLPHRTINHMHKLERKHSSGDLHSRLKTRKLLGVGETDDGDVHRSKLSQILGHSERLHTKVPRGLRVWQCVLAIVYTVISVWALLLPKSLYIYTLKMEADDAVILPIRLYGSALLGFAMLFWVTLQMIDKEVVRWSLLCSVVYFVVQILVTSWALLQMGEFLENVTGALLHRVLLAAGSAYYYWCMNDHNRLSRRSASAQDISSGSPK